MLLSLYEDRELPHYISLSFGKDSLCMLFMLLERGIRIDEAIFYNTGMEFKAIYDIRDISGVKTFSKLLSNTHY